MSVSPFAPSLGTAGVGAFPGALDYRDFAAILSGVYNTPRSHASATLRSLMGDMSTLQRVDRQASARLDMAGMSFSFGPQGFALQAFFASVQVRAQQESNQHCWTPRLPDRNPEPSPPPTHESGGGNGPDCGPSPDCSPSSTCSTSESSCASTSSDACSSTSSDACSASSDASSSTGDACGASAAGDAAGCGSAGDSGSAGCGGDGGSGGSGGDGGGGCGGDGGGGCGGAE